MSMPEPEGDCVNDDMLAALADGTLDAPERATALAHVATCATCRGRLASIAKLLADPEVAKEAARVERPGRTRIAVAVSLGLAAVLLLALLPRELLRRAPAPEHRAPPSMITGGMPTVLYPVGRVAAATQLRWSAVADADRYRASIFDAEGKVLLELASSDTVVTVPDSVVLKPRHRYFWRVEARLAIDRWSASPLVEFEVAEGRER